MIKFDCHTHSVMSGHAFSTVEEIVAACVSRGLEGFALTDHGPAMPASAQSVYFEYLPMLPREIDGIHILNGVEANIVNYEGQLDLDHDVCKKLDVVIASFHDIVIKPSSIEAHTNAYMTVISNPFVDIIGHPGRGAFIFDIDQVITACKQQNKMIEMNNQTVLQESDPSFCMNIAQACMDKKVPIVISSDAHISRHVGRVERVENLLATMNFPEELIANLTYERFANMLSIRKSNSPSKAV